MLIKILFFFLLLIGSVQAQEEMYKNYTVEDGLPSSEVYYSFQDSKGYMWFATDAGVSRFNGYEFENFTTEDGLTDNTVFKITEDSRKRIWFAPFNGRICYYDNDTIIEPSFMKKNRLRSLNYLESFYVDSLDNIWIGCLFSGILCISKEGEQQQMITLPEGRLLMTKTIKVERERIVGSLLSNVGMKALKSSNSTSLSFYGDTIIDENEAVNPNNTFYGIEKISGNNNFTCYLKSQNLCVRDRSGVLTKLPLSYKTRAIYLSVKDSIISLGVENLGVYKYLYKGGELILLNRRLEKRSVSSIYIDKSEGIWYTTLSNGIYYQPLRALSRKIFPTKQIYNIATDKKNKILYVSLRNGQLFKISDSIRMITELKNNLLSIYFNEDDNSLNFWNVDDNGLVKCVGEGLIKTTTLKEFPAFKSMLIKDNIIYSVNSMGLSVISDTVIYSSYNTKESRLWCTSLAFHNNKLWIGTNEGLRVLNNKKIQKVSISKDYLNPSVTSMVEINDSLLAVGTKQEGLLLVKNGQLERTLNIKSGLVNNTVTSIHLDENGVLWCGTNKGVTRVKGVGEDSYTYYNITRKQGLTSEEIKSIKSIGDTVFIGTAKGVLVINSKELVLNKVPPNLFFRNFSVNSIEKERKNIGTLKYNENNISIEYLGVNYRSQGAVNYKYRLIGEGTDTNWMSTPSRIVQYTLLPPSDYIFEVKAENEDGFWSKPIKTSFIIYPPYWKTWWFISFVVLCFALLLFWVLYSFFKRRETKIKIEKKLIELELKALRSQMNPHFIFNILNSIQHFMLQNNFKETNHYLSQFAKLIRTVLNLSEKNIITIGEEAEMLKLYMNLEKMRFENGFDYEIILGEEVDEDYDEIPSMLIQPYIENAIWHGLMNKKSKGRIIIKIDIIDDYLFCSVSDNGIGRDKAKEIKLNRKMKHKSVGMRITKDRLDLLNSETDVNVEIIDKVDEFNKPLGTEVNIKVKYVN